MTPVMIVEGFSLPAKHPLTAYDAAWVDALRSITGDRVQSPSLRTVQGLRRLLAGDTGP
jgi:hypothetical protein